MASRVPDSSIKRKQKTFMYEIYFINLLEDIYGDFYVENFYVEDLITLHEDLFKAIRLLFETPQEKKNRDQREYRVRNKENFVKYEDNRKNKEERKEYKRKKNIRDNMMSRGEEVPERVEDIVLPDKKKNISNLESSVIKAIRKNFPSLTFKERVRPSWLINPETGKPLELDLYFEREGLAIEVQGQQHYKIVKGFRMKKSDLLYQKYKDQVKRETCPKHGVVLLEFKYSDRLEDLMDDVKLFLEMFTNLI